MSIDSFLIDVIGVALNSDRRVLLYLLRVKFMKLLGQIFENASSKVSRTKSLEKLLKDTILKIQWPMSVSKWKTVLRSPRVFVPCKFGRTVKHCKLARGTLSSLSSLFLQKIYLEALYVTSIARQASIDARLNSSIPNLNSQASSPFSDGLNISYHN